MVELILVFCMVAAPDRCIERREELDQAVGTLACATLAQQIGQRYLTTHPDWRLANWRCQDASRHQEPV